MKILVASLQGDGCWFCALFRHEGHDADWVIGADKYAGALEGIVPAPLENIGHPADYDLIVFDQNGAGASADDVKIHTPTIGSSALADELEFNRVRGLEFMESCGIAVPPWKAFDSTDSAISWLRETHKRTVFKPMGAADTSTTYVSKDSEDMERYLGILAGRIRMKEFVLQEFVHGTEVSTEGWFNGTDWFAHNHTLETKKLLSGDLGPATGCSGNVVWMPNRPTALFERGLQKATDLLCGYDYCGPIDLNAIVTDSEVFGLEWTPRFGYDATACFTRLLSMPFGEFCYQIALGDVPTLGAAKAPFCASFRLHVPPYPAKSDPKKYAGVPIKGISVEHIDEWYLSDVRIKPGTDEMETIGTDGFIGAYLAVGNTIHEAFDNCRDMIGKIMIPDLGFRNDVEECVVKRYLALQSQGWLRQI